MEAGWFSGYFWAFFLKVERGFGRWVWRNSLALHRIGKFLVNIAGIV